MAEVGALLAPAYSWCSVHFRSLLNHESVAITVRNALSLADENLNDNHIVSIIARIINLINDAGKKFNYFFTS